MYCLLVNLGKKSLENKYWFEWNPTVFKTLKQVSLEKFNYYKFYLNYGTMCKNDVMNKQNFILFSFNFSKFFFLILLTNSL